MVARDVAARQAQTGDASTTRIGAAALPLGVVVLVVAEMLHPAREDPMDFPAVFAEYAGATSGPPCTWPNTSAFCSC